VLFFQSVERQGIQFSMQGKINGQDLQDLQDKRKKNPVNLVNLVQNSVFTPLLF